MAHFVALLELVRGPNEDKGRVCTTESMSGGRGGNSLLMENSSIFDKSYAWKHGGLKGYVSASCTFT